MHVGDALGCARRSGRAADTPAHFDARDRCKALERAEHELVVAQEIESQPVDVVERVVENRDEVGGVRQRVALVTQGLA